MSRKNQDSRQFWCTPPLSHMNPITCECGVCKKCRHRTYMRTYRSTHAESLKDYNHTQYCTKGYSARNAQYRKTIGDKRRQRNTGHTPEYFQNCLTRQLNKCAVCSRDFTENNKSHADHNHDTGKPRGVLCLRCNHFLGWVEKYHYLLIKIERYLKEYSASTRLASPIGLLDRASKQRWVNTGHTPEYFRDKMEAQARSCAVCERMFDGRKSHADHNHITGAPRGILCVRCNLLVGKTERNLQLLPTMREYLKTYG